MTLNQPISAKLSWNENKAICKILLIKKLQYQFIYLISKASRLIGTTNTLVWYAQGQPIEVLFNFNTILVKQIEGLEQYFIESG